MLTNISKVTFNDQFGNPCGIGDTIVYFSKKYGIRKCTIIKIEQMYLWDDKIGTNIKVRPITDEKHWSSCVSLRKSSSFMKV